MLSIYILGGFHKEQHFDLSFPAEDVSFTRGPPAKAHFNTLALLQNFIPLLIAVFCLRFAFARC